MKEKKSIDRIFQEKFKDFEKEPPEKVWDNIASRLDKKDKKKPLIIPIWFKIGGVAAVLAIILSSLLFIDVQDPVSGEPGVVFEKPEEPTNKQEDSKDTLQKENKTDDPEASLAADEEDPKSKTGGQNSASGNNSSSTSEGIANTNNSYKTTNKNTNPGDQSNSEAVIAINEQKTNTTYENWETKNPSGLHKINPSGNIVQSDSVKKDFLIKEENALAQVEEEKKKTENEEEVIAQADSKKMELSTFAAPVFYKNIGGGNELSNQLSNNSTSSQVTVSYGMKIAYKISDRFKIRTGISKIDINQNIQDISYSPTALSVGFENISSVEDNVQIRDNSPTPSENGLPMGELDRNNSLSTSVFTPGEIKQQFGYIEVPLEMEYVLIDKQFGLNIIGGGSSLFLDNNRVQLVAGESKTDLGEATNINNTSFSTNIGVGMDYKLTDKFSISVEPIFKYQINAFDRVDNVQPVNFGIYSGLSFNF
ncbi:hypothetical protein [Christiangramia sp.]|uniref:hypothetical protein n=1 Tax=Christiangramia sp. TaxID=1931228 RepID=UPI002604A906|nr:hypothetical protein [Christiangramia sp.]